MRRLLFILICFSFYQLNAQTINSGEYIAVIGKGSGSYVPDMVTFDFSISSIDKKQNIAVKKLNDQSERTIKRITSLGYNPKDIKLSNYNLGDAIDYSGEKPKNNGFEASISFELEIKYNDKDFNMFIDSISTSKIPDLSFTYQMSFSDSLRDKIKNELISKASDDANQTAKVLAKSRNLVLGNIFSIEYTANNYALYGEGILPVPPPPPPQMDRAMESPRISASISMRGIQTEQQVRIIYRITNTN